jgi:hypothetical protein
MRGGILAGTLNSDMYQVYHKLIEEGGGSHTRRPVGAWLYPLHQGFMNTENMEGGGQAHGNLVWLGEGKRYAP